MVIIMAYQFTNEKNIWQLRQNVPALIVEDCRSEFHLSDIECERLCEILLERGVNKWLYCRLLFLDLKHDVKKLLSVAHTVDRHCGMKSRNSGAYQILQHINSRMQNIAKTPRFVVWGKKPHKHMANNRKEIEVRGRHC